MTFLREVHRQRRAGAAGPDDHDVVHDDLLMVPLHNSVLRRWITPLGLPLLPDKAVTARTMPRVSSLEHKPPPTNLNPPLISGRELTKKFGPLTAVDSIDFDVRAGEAFGFLGPNGAGKTS